MKKLRAEHFFVCAVEQSRRARPYNRTRANAERIALIFGNEVRGLPDSVLARADKVIEIPLRGAMVRHAHHPRRTRRGKESLNVSVAAGVAIFRILNP